MSSKRNSWLWKSKNKPTIIENEISESKYTKKDKDFDKSKILQDIIISVFGDLNESEVKWLENQVQQIIDNKLVNIYKTSIKIINYSIKIIFNERVQSTIPLLGQIPFHGLTSINQLVVYSLASEIGLSYKIIAIILLFL